MMKSIASRDPEEHVAKRILMASENEEVEFPEEVIQHIQSFLKQKDVVRTSILSKLWYSAWSTHLHLYLSDFDFHEIRTNGFSKVFQDFSRKTMNRYKTFNLKLERFRIRMLMTPNDSESPRLVNELVVDALNLGVNDLSIGVFGKYDMPNQVSASIISSHIVSLELVGVTIGDDMMRGILLGCPLIEKLNLRDCVGFKKVEFSPVRRTLKHFSVRHTPPRLFADSPSIEFEGHGDQSLTYGNLISLLLNNVKIADQAVSKFLHRFPNLEKLILQDCGFLCNDLNSSISYTKFNERTSHINLCVLRKIIRASWYSTIRKFLKDLSLSGISLTIDATKVDNFDEAEVIHTGTLPVVELENLTIKTDIVTTSKYCRFFYGLLRSLRPKFLTPSLKDEIYSTLDVVYEELKNRVNENRLQTIQVFHIYGLQEATLEIYEKSLRMWRPAQREALKDVREGEEIRFRLEWG